MARRFLRWFLALLLAGFYGLPSLYAQSTASIGEGPESKGNALPYTISFMALLLVMVVMCAPSRKPIRE